MQRVTRAAVHVEQERIAQIGAGALVLLGILEGDGQDDAQRLAERIARFRIFADEQERMNRSALDEGLALLVVSQFTLAADGRRGRRPSFDRAARPQVAEHLCQHFVDTLKQLGLPVSTGRFGARMRVELENDGPVTFVLEHPPRPRPSQVLT